MLPWANSRPNGISSSSAAFAQLTAKNWHTLQWAAPFLPSDYPSPWGILTPSNTWFLELTRVLKVNRISIGSTVFALLTTVIDRPRDHATQSVTMGCIKLYSDTNYCKGLTVLFMVALCNRETIYIFIL